MTRSGTHQAVRSILITGGAGFVGSNLAKLFRKQDAHARIVAFDNLRRRGAEQNLPEFQKLGIEFVHGDIRNPEDLAALSGHFDLLIEASAEPSVLAGLQGAAASYLVGTNLTGTGHALEFARTRVGSFVFLSTSRVYSIDPLRSLPLREGSSRLELDPNAEPPLGFTPAGISEEFEVLKPRSLYGATKLASEFLVQEYARSFGVRSLILRCGVIAGSGQFGKVDQGVFTLWVARHLQKKGLRYTGFGGKGLQVRDLLHPSDLFRAIELGLTHASSASPIFNLGGGPTGSVSMKEFTALCEAVTGNIVQMDSVPETHPVDIPYFVTDSSKAQTTLGWTPTVQPEAIVREIHSWLKTVPLDTLFP